MQLALSDIRQSIPQVNWKPLGIPALVLLIIAMLILPLPTFLLDILFTLNIMIGLIVIMIAIHTERPLDFSSFPAVLLFATMLRLSLNVASTRIVLVNGHEGTDAAGKVIEAFGKFVISGNYLVGFIIFGILRSAQPAKFTLAKPVGPLPLAYVPDWRYADGDSKRLPYGNRAARRVRSELGWLKYLDLSCDKADLALDGHVWLRSG